MRSFYEVKQVTFYPGGEAVIDYAVLPEDVRDNGLAKTHGIMVTPQGDFEDLLEDFRDFAERALRGVLERFDEASPEEMPMMEMEGDDEEPSPFDNPLER